ncbi:MAG: bifunctional demethylmenaquinone methyltransferase/2-methoxy-6-polyprenyl-1,4-benzoquinol methylase UbiE, partial [Planctomycetota bacterium]
MAVDKSRNRVKQMFGAIAPRYDRMNHLLSFNIDRYWRWYAVRRVPPRETAPILDVCTGTGDLAFAFLRRTKGRAPVVAADFCDEMLEIGRRKQRKVPHGDRVTFVEADAQDLPFKSGTFQIVSVAFGLRNVADVDRALREMTRVCRSGGQVLVLEFSLPRRQPMSALYGWYFHQVLPRIGQWLARNEHQAYRYLPESVGEFPEGPALVGHLEAAGLRDVRYYPLTMGVATLYVGVQG